MPKQNRLHLNCAELEQARLDYTFLLEGKIATKKRGLLTWFLTELKQARSDYTQAGIELAHLQSRLHTQNESEQRLQKKIVEQTMQIETLMRAQRGEAIRAGS